LQDILQDIDVVNLMSVNPGFGGQTFIPIPLTKIKTASSTNRSIKPECKIEIDGGVTLQNAKSIMDAGAHISL
jgi:ribulose-phosphate 3-epimerase